MEYIKRQLELSSIKYTILPVLSNCKLVFASASLISSNGIFGTMVKWYFLESEFQSAYPIP